MEAYSPDTNTHYPNWDALTAAEANGYVVVGISSREDTVPIVVGPYGTKEEGKRAQARLRRRWKNDEARDHGDGITVKAYLRVLWKEDPTTVDVAEDGEQDRLEQAEALICDVLTEDPEFEQAPHLLDQAAVLMQRLLASGYVVLAAGG